MITGVDVSKWQGKMKWNVCQYAGARFAFIRAGSVTLAGGTCYTDYEFERNANTAPDFMPVGFYWYFRPQHNPERQANYFVDLIRDKQYKLPPVMDLEEDGDLSPAEVTASAVIFGATVYKRISVWPLLYGRAEWLNLHTVPALQWGAMDLWIARYNPLLDGPWSDKDCIPRDWKTWRFWQVSAKNGRGAEFGAESASICMDFFNGDQAAFDVYLGAAAGEQLGIINGAFVVPIRSGPGGPVIGGTWKGSAWPVLGCSEDGGYYRVEGWVAADNVDVL
jgi:lysozyme